MYNNDLGQCMRFVVVVTVVTMAVVLCCCIC
jgi:hypothetical protein